MVHFPLILFAILEFFESQYVSAIMCYNCVGNDCASDPANKVECAEGNLCGLEIRTIFYQDSSENPSPIEKRFCEDMPAGDPKQNSCSIIGYTSDDITELCQCNKDFCNANEPDCSTRVFNSKMIRESLAEKCKNEIEKWMLETDNGKLDRPRHAYA